MIRLGLCCKFHQHPVAFKAATATALSRLPRPLQLQKLSRLALENAESLRQALAYCAGHGIGCFRVNSQILPVKTHPLVGYRVEELPDAPAVVAAFKACGRFAKTRGLRLTFHPDQFINIHAGGAYGDKPAALRRLAAVLRALPRPVRARLTLENDDRTYTPADLLPLCRETGTPFVYDVHHHRCLPDGLTVAEVTRQALATWDREPLFHVSSPKDGHGSKNPRAHHDFIDPADFPQEWRRLTLTVEVEAKAKETAVARLRQHLATIKTPLWRTPAPETPRP
jgi:UV DNA damage endonuclease